MPTVAEHVPTDLLVGALDGRDNRDDRGNTDDDAEHGQEGTHFVGPDPAKRQPDILNHIPIPSVPSLIFVFAPSRTVLPKGTAT